MSDGSALRFSEDYIGRFFYLWLKSGFYVVVHLRSEDGHGYRAQSLNLGVCTSK